MFVDKWLQHLLELLDLIDSANSKFILTFNDSLFEMYFITGGMNDVVYIWVEDRDIKAEDDVLVDILLSYESDFGKHTDKYDANKFVLFGILYHLTLQRKIKKFYSMIKKGHKQESIKMR